MANGSNTASILGGVGLLSAVIPPQNQSAFQSALDTAKGLTTPAPSPNVPAGAGNSIAPGPSPMAPQTGGFIAKAMAFMRTPTGIIAGLVVIGLLAFKFYKGRK